MGFWDFLKRKKKVEQKKDHAKIIYGGYRPKDFGPSPLRPPTSGSGVKVVPKVIKHEHSYSYNNPPPPAQEDTSTSVVNTIIMTSVADYVVDTGPSSTDSCSYDSSSSSSSCDTSSSSDYSGGGGHFGGGGASGEW